MLAEDLADLLSVSDELISSLHGSRAEDSLAIDLHTHSLSLKWCESLRTEFYRILRTSCRYYLAMIPHSLAFTRLTDSRSPLIELRCKLADQLGSNPLTPFL